MKVVSRILSAAALAGALVAVAACAAEKPSGEPFGMMSLDEVEKLVGKPGVFIVDANDKDVFAKNHLPGASWYKAAPFDQLLPPAKDTTLVFYCASPT